MTNSRIESCQMDIMRQRPVALYYQIAENMQSMIRNGTVKIGENLPTEKELRETYGVSAATIRAAMGLLISQGIARRDRGRTPYVIRDKEEYRIGGLTGFTENMLAQGRSVRSVILRLDYTNPPPVIAKSLQLARKAKTVFLKRLRFVDNIPLEINIHHIPKYLVPRLVKKGLQKESLYEIYRKDYGLSLTEADETVEAICISEEQARLLQCKVGLPGLLITRIVRDKKKRVIEYSVSVFAGSHIRYHSKLRLDP